MQTRRCILLNMLAMLRLLPSTKAGVLVLSLPSIVPSVPPEGQIHTPTVHLLLLRFLISLATYLLSDLP